MSDEGGRFATPYEVVQVTSPEMAASKVLEVIEREGVERLVLGLPVTATQVTRHFLPGEDSLGDVVEHLWRDYITAGRPGTPRR